MTGEPAPPSWAQRARELRLPLDVLRLLAASPGLRSSPRGDGRPVGMGVDPDAWRVVADRLARDV